MSGPSFISSALKVILIGAVMAIGAGGFYVLAANRRANDRASQVIAPTATASVAGAPTAVVTGTPADTATPAPLSGTPEPAALTDTGYKALDGRPLYAECIQAGAPMPPQIPTPAATQIPLPTIDPSADPNEGKPAPAPDELPTFDPRTIAPADTTGWLIRESTCYGYAFAYPPDWKLTTPFTNAGYQQGENATITNPSRTASIEIAVYYTPVDYLARAAGQRFSGSDKEYLLATTEVSKAGRRGIEVYYLERTSLGVAIHLDYLYSVRPDWFLAMTLSFGQQNNQAAVAQLRAIIDSLAY